LPLRRSKSESNQGRFGKANFRSLLELDRLTPTRSSFVLSSNFIALLIAARFNLKRYCS
jgi:hypothetical protein